jgi:pimeloyl-ACP methyl ester carboxylesterase
MAGTAFLSSRITVDDMPLQVTEIGRAGSPAIIFLHGWPQDASAWIPAMRPLAPEAHCIAIDLPGVDGSAIPPLSGEKNRLADIVRGAMDKLAVKRAAIVGHDVGGMIAYAFLRQFPGRVSRAVIMNTAIPGVDPWKEVYGNPAAWHFRFHAIPGLPEDLVAGHEAEYFAYFFRILSKNPSKIDVARYAKVYASPHALKAGFDWYRALPADAKANSEPLAKPLTTPVLVVRGDAEVAGIATSRYVDGLKRSGLIHADSRTIADCGHFSPDEQPEAVARLIREFALGAVV